MHLYEQTSTESGPWDPLVCQMETYLYLKSKEVTNSTALLEWHFASISAAIPLDQQSFNSLPLPPC